MELGSTVGAVRSQRVLMGHRLCPAVVRIKDGRIHRILSGSLFPAGDDDEDDEDEVSCSTLLRHVSHVSLLGMPRTAV